MHDHDKIIARCRLADSAKSCFGLAQRAQQLIITRVLPGTKCTRSLTPDPGAFLQAAVFGQAKGRMWQQDVSEIDVARLGLGKVRVEPVERSSRVDRVHADIGNVAEWQWHTEFSQAIVKEPSHLADRA